MTEKAQNQGYSLRLLITSISFLAGLVILFLTGWLLIKTWLFTFFEALPILALAALFLLIIFPVIVWKSFILVPYNTIWVMQRLGKHIKVKRAGLRIQIPFIDEIYSKQVLTRRTSEVVANEAPTIKGTTVDVKANLFYQLLPEDPARFILDVEKPDEYIVRVAEVAIRKLISAQNIEELQKIDEKDQVVIDDYLTEEVGDWTKFKLEISDIEFPPEIREAMARVEIAERDAKAKVIAANNEIEVMRLLRAAVRKELPKDTTEKYIQEQAMQLRMYVVVEDSDGTLPIINLSPSTISKMGVSK